MQLWLTNQELSPYLFWQSGYYFTVTFHAHTFPALARTPYGRMFEDGVALEKTRNSCTREDTPVLR